MTGRSRPEICETGEQGGSVAGLRLLVQCYYVGMLFLVASESFSQFDELLTEKATSRCDYQAIVVLRDYKDGK